MDYERKTDYHIDVAYDIRDSPAYSINGIRATGNTRGIVIRNGKKQVRQ